MFGDGLAAAEDGKPGVDHMLTAGQGSQHVRGFRLVLGFAQNPSINGYYRVCGDDQGLRVGGGHLGALAPGQLFYQFRRSEGGIYNFLPSAGMTSN